jgi:hypothetical protein
MAYGIHPPLIFLPRISDKSVGDRFWDSAKVWENVGDFVVVTTPLGCDLRSPKPPWQQLLYQKSLEYRNGLSNIYVNYSFPYFAAPSPPLFVDADSSTEYSIATVSSPLKAHFLRFSIADDTTFPILLHLPLPWL